MMETLLSIGLSNALIATLLAVVAFFASRLFRSPPLTHALWLLVIVKLLSPPLFAVPTPIPSLCLNSPTVSATQEFATTTGPNDDSPKSLRPGYQKQLAASPTETTLSTKRFELTLPESAAQATSPMFELKTLAFYFGIIWLTGTTVWILLLLRRVGSYRRLVSRTEHASDAIQQTAAHLSAKLGIRKVPSVRLIDATIAPHVWAMLGQSYILLPNDLVVRLNPTQLEMVLMHELVHLRRRDHRFRWLELAALALYWWQPIVWFARNQLNRAAEQCCDAWVVREFPSQARNYAATLLKTVEFLGNESAALPVGSTGFGEAHFFQRRFEMILQGSKADRLSWKTQLALTVFGLLVLPLAMTAANADSPEPVQKDSSNAVAAAPQQTKKEKDALTIEQRIERIEEQLKTLPASSAADQQVSPGNTRETRLPADDIPASIDDQQSLQNDPSLVDAMSKLDVPVRSIQGEIDLCQLNLNRKIAAEKQVAAVEAAFNADRVTLDLLLDAQRRAVDADVAYSNALLDLSRAEQEQRHALTKIRSLQQARQRALDVWRKVHVVWKQDQHDEKKKKQEADAREQYFYFRKMVQDALNAYYLAENRKAEA
jgi:beta-lactamase regulating signal transducer with metallopeptidase domain